MKNVLDKYGGKSKVESVNYSNGNLKGSYVNRKYAIPGTSFDGMAGPVQVRDMIEGMPAPMKHITTSKFSVLDPAMRTALAIKGKFGDNVEVKTVQSLTETGAKNPIEYVMGNHSLKSEMALGDVDEDLLENRDRSIFCKEYRERSGKRSSSWCCSR